MAYKTNFSSDLRAAITPRLDKYARFYWAGHDMWEEFGAFILNEKREGLKFYNGPSFSNSYASPQFAQDNSMLNDISFSTCSISFNIGVYAISSADYRKLIYCLHPMEINDLIFEFQKEWRYHVKLAKRADSTRYVIGTNADGEDLYYTELSLTFDIQGDSVALSSQAMSFGYCPDSTGHEIIFPIETDSDLNTPFELTCEARADSSKTDAPSLTINLIWDVDQKRYTKQLCKCVLNNENDDHIQFRYDSRLGNLYFKAGTSDTDELVNMLTTYTNGKRMVSALEVQSGYLPGTLETTNEIANPAIQLISSTSLTIDAAPEQYGVTAYARTNVI